MQVVQMLSWHVWSITKLEWATVVTVERSVGRQKSIEDLEQSENLSLHIEYKGMAELKAMQC